MIDNYKRLPRIRFLLGFTILLALGAFALNNAYQKHFNNIPLTASEQHELGISLLEFPRNMQTIANLPVQKWASFYVQPSPCNTLCVRTVELLQQIKHEADSLETDTGLEIQIITEESSGYSDYWSLVRSVGYANHFDRILMVNPEGQFAGSIIAPYHLAHWKKIDKQLNK